MFSIHFSQMSYDIFCDVDGRVLTVFERRSSARRLGLKTLADGSQARSWNMNLVFLSVVGFIKALCVAWGCQDLLGVPQSRANPPFF